MEELMTLSGIGKAKAKSIVDYRETHNGFQSIEEIKKIDGIKDSVYNKIKDSISVK
jgi:competence protein ComEA